MEEGLCSNIKTFWKGELVLAGEFMEKINPNKEK
jgi:hypothetical protein